MKIEYLSSAAQSYSARKVCGARCELCRAAGAACPQHTDVFAPAPAFADMPAGAQCHMRQYHLKLYINLPL